MLIKLCIIPPKVIGLDKNIEVKQPSVWIHTPDMSIMSGSRLCVVYIYRVYLVSRMDTRYIMVPHREEKPEAGSRHWSEEPNHTPYKSAAFEQLHRQGSVFFKHEWKE